MDRAVDEHFGDSPQTSARPLGVPSKPFKASFEEKVVESLHPPLRRLQGLGSSRNVGDLKPWEIGAAAQKVNFGNHPRPQDVMYFFDPRQLILHYFVLILQISLNGTHD